MAPDGDSAARAFAELGQKVTLLEAAVSGLAAKRDAAPDYSETLADVAALLERMHAAINDIAHSPAMQLTPEAMAERITAAGADARKSNRAAITDARERFDAAAQRIEWLGGTVATVHEQRLRLLWAAGGGLLAGILLWSILPGIFLRALPQGWHMPENMACHIIGEPTLWEVGTRRMQVGSPEAWNAIVVSAEMRRNNRDVIDACLRRAAKTKKVAHCSIRLAQTSRSQRTYREASVVG